MFDLSWAELAIIGIVAFLVIGPDELPGVIRGARKAMAYVKNLASEFTSAIDDVAKEADIDVKGEAQRINDEVKQIVDLDGNLQQTYDIEDFLKDDDIKRGTKDE